MLRFLLLHRQKVVKASGTLTAFPPDSGYFDPFTSVDWSCYAEFPEADGTMVRFGSVGGRPLFRPTCYEAAIPVSATVSRSSPPDRLRLPRSGPSKGPSGVMSRRFSEALTHPNDSGLASGNRPFGDRERAPLAQDRPLLPNKKMGPFLKGAQPRARKRQGPGQTDEQLGSISTALSAPVKIAAARGDHIDHKITRRRLAVNPCVRLSFTLCIGLARHVPSSPGTGRTEATQRNCPLFVRGSPFRSRDRVGAYVRAKTHVSQENIASTVDYRDKLAEGVGFEPTVELPPRRFSRPLP